MIINQFGDNPYAPGVVHDAYAPDQLVIGNFQLETQPIIVAGGAALLRGTVLGQVSVNSVIATPAAGNTGNGTVTAISRSAGSKQGNYVLTAKSATTLSVVDPEGAALPDATVGTAYNQSGIQFTVNAGATAYAAADSLTLNSMDATGQYIACVKTATDGSQTPKAILVDYTDATGGPVAGGAYLTGDFNERRVLYDNSWTLAVLRDALRDRSIFLKASVSADPPT